MLLENSKIRLVQASHLFSEGRKPLELCWPSEATTWGAGGLPGPHPTESAGGLRGGSPPVTAPHRFKRCSGQHLGFGRGFVLDFDPSDYFGDGSPAISMKGTQECSRGILPTTQCSAIFFGTESSHINHCASAGLCSVAPREGTRGTGHQLEPSTFHPHLRKHSFSVRVVNRWHRLPREAAEILKISVLGNGL